jgi:hypothetical protein
MFYKKLKKKKRIQKKIEKMKKPEENTRKNPKTKNNEQPRWRAAADVATPTGATHSSAPAGDK